MKKLIALLLALVMVLALAACGSTTDTQTPAPEPSQSATPAPSQPTEPAPAPAQTYDLIWAGTSASSGYYALNVACCDIINKYVDGVTVTLMETGGTVDDYKLMRDGEASFAQTSSVNEYCLQNDVAAYEGFGFTDSYDLMYPYYGFKQVSGDLFSLDHDFLTYCSNFGFSVSKDLPEDVVYRIIKAFDEHSDEIRTTYPGIADDPVALTADPNDSSLIHPGVVKYMQEKGIDVPANRIPG